MLAKTPRIQIALPDGTTVKHTRAKRLAALMHPKTINIDLEFFFAALRKFIAEGEIICENPFATFCFRRRDRDDPVP